MQEVCYREERSTEFTNEECLRRIGRPFSVGDIVLTVYIDPELLVSSAELLQSALRFVDLLDPVLCLAVSVFDLLCEGRQPWVELDYASAVVWDAIGSSVVHD